MPNRSWDSTHLVLWSGDSGSQNDDDVPRLYAVAWCSRFTDNDDLSAQDAAEALIYGYVRQCTASYETFDSSSEIQIHNPELDADALSPYYS